MFISEIYRSRQGEGLLTGTNSVFVRTSGCNLRCSFCDTPFASWDPEGEQLSIVDVMGQVNTVAEDAIHVVLTGGEPMLPREVIPLTEQLSRAGFHLTIETAGTIYHELSCDLMSISPKFSNSDPAKSRAGEWRQKHIQTRESPDTVRRLIQRYPYQLKFVVDQPSDIDEILRYVEVIQPDDRERILLMPQGVELDELTARGQWLEPLSDKHGFTFCPRRHIEWYGNRRGT